MLARSGCSVLRRDRSKLRANGNKSNGEDCTDVARTGSTNRTVCSLAAASHARGAVYRASVLEIYDIARRARALVGELRRQRLSVVRTLLCDLRRVRWRAVPDPGALYPLGCPICAPVDDWRGAVLGGTQRFLLHRGRLRTAHCLEPDADRSGDAGRWPLGAQKLKPSSGPSGYLTANTHTAPPWGTSGYCPGKIEFSSPCITAESMP